MIIYKDILNDGEILTDSYKITIVEGTEGTLMEVHGKVTTETTDIDDSKIGGNASAEAEDVGGAEASSVSGINIVIANKLEETGFSDGKPGEKEYKTHMKGYCKAILAKLQASAPERVDSFKKGAPEGMKKIIALFADCRFYVCEGCLSGPFEKPSPTCMVIPAYYEADGSVKMYYWKDGLEEEKA